MGGRLVLTSILLTDKNQFMQRTLTGGGGGEGGVVLTNICTNRQPTDRKTNYGKNLGGRGGGWGGGRRRRGESN